MGRAKTERKMADKPQGIVLTRHRDLTGRENHPGCAARCSRSSRRFSSLACSTSSARSRRPRARRRRPPMLSVYSPTRVRGGLLYTSRFHVTAHADLKKALLVLDSGWFEGMQVNSIGPQPVGEASRDGRVVFELGHIAKGQSSLLWIQFQVNPTNVGHRSQNVELDDGRHVISDHPPHDHGLPLMDIVLRGSPRLRVHLPADAHRRPPRAVVARAVRPDHARRARRPRAAGHHAERHVVHRAHARGRHARRS